MAGRLADAGQSLRRQRQTNRVNAALDRTRAGAGRDNTLARNIRRITGQNRAGGLATARTNRLRTAIQGRGGGSNPDPWNRRGARQTAQAQLRSRAAAGNAPQIVRNPRTGRRMAVTPNQGVLARA